MKIVGRYEKSDILEIAFISLNNKRRCEERGMRLKVTKMKERWLREEL